MGTRQLASEQEQEKGRIFSRCPAHNSRLFILRVKNRIELTNLSKKESPAMGSVSICLIAGTVQQLQKRNHKMACTAL